MSLRVQRSNLVFHAIAEREIAALPSADRIVDRAKSTVVIQ